MSEQIPTQADTPPSSEQRPDWQEVFCYFGNANYPSGATYREAGERVQYQEELYVELKPFEDKFKSEYVASPDRVAEFLATYEDCRFVVHDGYQPDPAYGGEYVAPSLFLLGWRELTTEEELREFRSDKAQFGPR